MNRSRNHSDRLNIGVFMLMIAGAALGLWLMLDQLRGGGTQ